jgi:hypothetical protein
MTQDNQTFLEMFKQLLLMKYPPGSTALPQEPLELFNMCYSAGRIDSIKEVVDLWKSIQNTTDISTIALDPRRFVTLLQDLIDNFTKDENKFGDLYAVESSLILPGN